MRIGFKAKGQKKVFLCVDIGAAAVKTLSFREGDSGQKEVLGASIDYFETDPFDTGPSGESARNAIAESIRNAISPAKISGSPSVRTIIGLPPNVLRARVQECVLDLEGRDRKMSKNEEKMIIAKIFNKAKKEISTAFAAAHGILPGEIFWNSLELIEMKIDGYIVSRLSGYGGRMASFKILASFLPAYHIEKLKKIAEYLGLNIIKISHISQGLVSWLKASEKSALFADIGGNMSQIFLFQNGVLCHIGDFQGGGEKFSEVLADTLGIDKNSARDLKESYSKKTLSPQTSEKIKGIFSEEGKNWISGLNLAVREAKSKLFPKDVFVFGGSAPLPEISGTLNKTRPSILYPKDIRDGLSEKISKESQYTPSILIINERVSF